MAKGKYIYILGLVVLGSWMSGPLSNPSTSISGVEYDSVELAKDSIYICDEHYFEWCKEPAICPYCGEALQMTDLWSYYKLLECEDCQKFFDDHYEQFISE